MNLEKFEEEYKKLGTNIKMAVIEKFNRELIKNKIDVSFFKPIIANHEEYYRTYFQVSLALRKDIDDKFLFIEDNFYLFHDWWHVDTMMCLLDNSLKFDYAFNKAQKYIKSNLPYVRRLGYVIFIPRLVKDKKNVDKLLSLLKNDDHYHVVMGEAWLISYLAMCDADKVYNYLKNCDLKYSIVGKAIQKICDSYRISDEDKERFKGLRNTRRLIK